MSAELTLEDARRYLNTARIVLDRIADDEAGPDEAAAMAQRIVDVIGHSITDEPPHLLVELDELRDELNQCRGHHA